MGAFNLYGKAYANMLGGEIAADVLATDFLTDTMKYMLVTATYAVNLDTHETKADVTDEISGTGYTAGGVTLASKTITYTAANTWATVWAVATAYTVGQVVRPTTGNGNLYMCIVAGTSHATTEPIWPTGPRATIADNTATWAQIGRGITVVDFADPQWTAATLSAIRRGIVYRDSGTAATSPLFGVHDLDGPHAVTNGTFTVTIPATGLFHFHTA